MKARLVSAIVLVVGLLLIIRQGVATLGVRAQGPEPDKPLQASTPLPTPPPQLEPTPTPTPSIDPNRKEEFDLQSAERVGPLSAPPSNDDFNGAALITALPYQQTVDTTGAAVAPDDPDMASGSGVNSNTIWYRLVPSSSGLIEVNTFGSNYDTVLAVFTGMRGSLTWVTSNDDARSTFQSQVIFEVEADRTYYVSVADYGSPGGGLLNLTVKLEASGAVKTKVLEPGDDLIHGFTYYNGYLWASTRTYPARILKIDPDTLDYQRIVLDSGLDDGEDILAAAGYIWVILYTQPAKIIRVNPDTLEWQVAITFGSNELSYGGSLEYAFGYLWAGGHDRKIAKVDLSNLAYQVYSYPTITSNSQFHALTGAGGYIWASAPHYSWWGWYADTVIRINPNNPTDYSTVYIDTFMSDDMAYSDGHLYTGSEAAPSFVYRFANDLTYDSTRAFDYGSYGIFAHDGDIWSAHIGSPGRIIKFNTNLEMQAACNLPDGFNNANDIAFDPDGYMYVTAWESPAKIVKFDYDLACYPNDPYFSEQWGLHKIEIEDAWSSSRGANSIVIAVIDSGVDYTHVDLGHGKTLTDNDHDFVNNRDDAMDDHGHGTHVAGIAAANTNNGQGIAGVCPGCGILPLKVVDSEGTDEEWDNIVNAIRYAADQEGVRVINMSLGDDSCTPELAEAVNYAYNRNVVLVAISHNSCPVDVALDLETFEVTYPAKFERVIAVGATTFFDGRAVTSNYGPELDVMAPGWSILSTDINPEYKRRDGTSMASPMVAGLAGLVLSQNPSLTPAQVQAILEESADDIGSEGWDEQTGWGRINAGQAMQTTVGTVAPAPPVTCTVSSANEPNIIQSREEDLVSLYTQLRNEVLMSSEVGQSYVDLYYEYGPELAGILLTNSDLRSRTGQFLDNASEAFGSLLPDSTAEVVLDQALYDEADALVQDLAAAGSEEFQEEMVQVWADMELDQHIGEKATDIWKGMQNYVYLPLLLKNYIPGSQPALPIVETLNFRIGFQARDNADNSPQNVPIKVKIKNLSGDQTLFETDWVSVTPAGSSGNWGTASVHVSSAALTPSESYQIFVQGAMHLAKQVTIPLTDGLTIDYTDPALNPDGVLWACDINQDNQIRDTDVAIVLSHFGTAPTDPDPSSEAYRSDQNGDGVVNSFDYSICLANFGKVGD